MANFLASVILVPALIQGAYYPAIFLAAAIPLFCVAVFKKQHKLSRCEQLLWGIAVLYLIASIVNGYASDSLAHACLPLVCAIFLYLYTGLSASEKKQTLNAVIIGGSVLAGVSILAFCSAIPIPGSVASHRLQSTFQYANAAGSWFAALAVLAQDHNDIHIRRLCIPIITALFLTQSVGALGLYVVIQLIRLWKNNRECILSETIFLHILAVGFAIGFYFASNWTAWIAMLVMCILAGCLEKPLRAVGQIHFKWLIIVVTVIAAIMIFSSHRFISSLSTFAERLVQIADGIRVIAAHPLFGLGAGNWEIAYPYYQSAQYTSAVVHSGIIQIGVDSGVITMIAAILFSVMALKTKGRVLAENLAAFLLVAHSVLDFTMQFFPIASLALAIIFIGEERKPETQNGMQSVHRFALCFAGMLCVGMLYGQIQYRRMASQVQDGAWDRIEIQYERSQTLFGESWAARNLYVRALYLNGKPEKVVRVTENIYSLTAEETLIQAQALQQTGMQDRACQLLLEQLGKQIYRTALFAETARMLLEWDADPKYLDEYNTLVDIANSNQSILGSLKGDQVYIEKILS